MLPLMMMIPLLGAGAGALISKKDPLKGALMGGALGFGGAALAPGLLGAAGAGSAAAGTAGAATGASQAGLLAAQEAGLGASSLGWGGAETGAQGGLNGLIGSETGASVGGFAGDAASTYSKYAKPINAGMTAANIGMQMAKASEPQPIQAPQRQSVPLDLSGILTHSQNVQSYEQQEDERRRQLMQQYSSGIGRF